MLEQDTVVVDRPTGGRHRLPASSLRQAVRRMSLGAAAVVLTIGLGLLAAVATGLTGTPVDDLGGFPAPSTEAEAGPTSARAAGIGARLTAEQIPASDGDVPELASDAVQPEPVPVGAASPTPAEDPAPDDGAERSPVPTVRPGDPCPGEGAAGSTAGGPSTVCTQRGDGRTRWRLS
jgi:hypothetical protein